MEHYVLGDIVTEISERENNPSNSSYDRFVGLEHYVSGEVEIENYGTTSNLNSAMKVFKSGDILVARRNVYLKRASVVYFDGLTSGDSIVLRPKDEILGRILPFILNTDDFWDYADQYSDGTMSKRLSPKVLKKYEFDLPEDNLEQFADILWAMVDVKKSYQTLLKKTDELVKSQFIEMFGDPIENPKSWKKLQLQDFVSADCSISYGIVKPGDDVPGGVPVFRPVDIVGRQPVLSEMKRTAPEISNQYKRTLLTGRELLITVRANIADTYIIDDTFKDCNVGRGIVPIRTNEEIMRLEFLKGQMDYDTLHEYIKSQAKGIALIQLNMEDLRKIEFIIPPVELQDEYILFMEQSDKSKFELKQAIEGVDVLIKSLIQQELN